jgi:hypothetical protein
VAGRSSSEVEIAAALRFILSLPLPLLLLLPVRRGTYLPRMALAWAMLVNLGLSEGRAERNLEAVKGVEGAEEPLLAADGEPGLVPLLDLRLPPEERRLPLIVPSGLR